MKTKIISIIAFSLFVCAAAYAQGITWIPANPMNKARAFFTATKLLNGDVLVAGGYDGTIVPPIFPDAEIYNWHTGLWTPISPMNLARAAAVDVRLEDGRVLAIGGADADFNFLDSAEIYDPSTGTWSFTGLMNEPRFEDFVGVILPGHKVLIAGGFGPPFNALNSAEIYDEATNTWTPTGSMNVARAEFAHVVLHDGRVLAVGGVADDLTAIASAEIYNPATGVWTLTGSMSTGRNDAAVVVLQDGRVLAAGGGMGDEELPRYASAEIFDPNTGQWTPTSSMTAPRSETEHAVLRLPDGRVLVPGGHTAPHAPVSSADLYNPTTGTWSAAGFMSVLRAGHVAVLLDSGTPLVMGGYSVEGGLSTTSVDIARVAPLARPRPTPAPRPAPTATATATPTPTPTRGPIQLTAVGHQNTVDLTWTGATSTNIDIYLNNALRVTVPNTGSYTDPIGCGHYHGFLFYQVCEAGTATCSNIVNTGTGRCP